MSTGLRPNTSLTSPSAPAAISSSSVTSWFAAMYSRQFNLNTKSESSLMYFSCKRCNQLLTTWV
jgi:hypothetical protein